MSVPRGFTKALSWSVWVIFKVSNRMMLSAREKKRVHELQSVQSMLE